MTKSSKYKVISTVSIIGIIFILRLISYERARLYVFNGEVEHVVYDEQHVPTITIKGLEYNLIYNNWGHHKDTIEVGDTMIKARGEVYIKLIKNNKRRSGFSH